MMYCLYSSLRTSETNYLNESYAFYSAIRMRGYYSKANKEERCVSLIHTETFSVSKYNPLQLKRSWLAAYSHVFNSSWSSSLLHFDFTVLKLVQLWLICNVIDQPVLCVSCPKHLVDGLPENYVICYTVMLYSYLLQKLYLHHLLWLSAESRSLTTVFTVLLSTLICPQPPSSEKHNPSHQPNRQATVFFSFLLLVFPSFFLQKFLAEIRHV